MRVLVAGLDDEELVEEERGDEAAEAEGEGDADGGDGDGGAAVALQHLRVQLHADEEEVENEAFLGGVRGGGVG